MQKPTCMSVCVAQVLVTLCVTFASLRGLPARNKLNLASGVQTCKSTTAF